MSKSTAKIISLCDISCFERERERERGRERERERERKCFWKNFLVRFSFSSSFEFLFPSLTHKHSNALKFTWRYFLNSKFARLNFLQKNTEPSFPMYFSSQVIATISWQLKIGTWNFVRLKPGFLKGDFTEFEVQRFINKKCFLGFLIFKERTLNQLNWRLFN